MCDFALYFFHMVNSCFPNARSVSATPTIDGTVDSDKYGITPEHPSPGWRSIQELSYRDEFDPYMDLSIVCPCKVQYEVFERMKGKAEVDLTESYGPDKSVSEITTYCRLSEGAEFLDTLRPLLKNISRYCSAH